MSDLVDKAKAGDQLAFEQLTREATPKLRAVIWRMVGHPEDCEDVVQAALLKAWQSLASFQKRAAFSTWLISIGTRVAIDHLRERKRWRRESQVAYANLCADNPEWQAELMAPMMEPEFTFDAREHVAYCFVCIGRSLPPDEQAALVLRDVMDFSNREAANVLGTSESVLRHRLTAARTGMVERYDGLCALVSKTGICHQCEGLGLAAQAVGGRKEALPDVDDLAKRMAVVRGVDPQHRRDARLQDIFFRRTAAIEEQGIGSTSPEICD